MTLNKLPEAVVREAQSRSDRDWDYWSEKVLPHVAAMIAQTLPSVEPAARQQFIRATLDTVEQWIRAEPAA